MFHLTKLNGFVACLLMILAGGISQKCLAFGQSDATHKQVRTISPEMDGIKAHLNTYCVAPDNNLWLCCQNMQQGSGALLIYAPDGEKLRQIDLTFVPQAINFAPDGSLFVAGSGKIAKMSIEGEILREIEAPNLVTSEDMLEKIKKTNEEQLESMLSSFQSQQEQIDRQIAKLEEPATQEETEKQLTRRERRLKMLRTQKEQVESMVESIKSSFSDQNGELALSRLKRASAISVTKEDLFVSLPAAAGYGYSIWRLDHALDNPTIVVESVSGCCGQLDIQCDDENLLIAENTKFQVGVYDRDGKRLRGFGQRASSSDDGFGSCCNPMNVRCVNGEILTAESSIGDIKRFSPEGELLGYIGRASVGGGCKHVAIGFDASRNWHYMMIQDTSSIAVLVPNAEAPAETDDERIARESLDGIGRKIYGTWEVVLDSKDKLEGEEETENGFLTNSFDNDGGVTEMYGHLEFAPQGKLVARSRSAIVSTAASNEAPRSGGFFATIASFFSSSSTATRNTVRQDESNQDRSAWKAIRENEGKFEFVIIQDRVRSYGAAVEFIGEDEARFQWFYGSSSSPMGQPALYKRLSTQACGKDCNGERCEKPEQK